jgi:hypothetical protein
MMAIDEALSRAVEQLLGRASGPLHFRLLIQPAISAVLAVRAGLKDARGGQPFLWGVVTDEAERSRLVRSAWKDIGKLFLMGLALDSVYQAIALRAYFPLQALIVAVVCAVLPYVLIRGPVMRLARRSRRTP